MSEKNEPYDVDINETQYDIVNDLLDARANKKAWEDHERKLREALLRSLQYEDDINLVYNNLHVAEIRNRISTRFDRALFKVDWPKLDGDYSQLTHSKVITLFDQNEEG